MNASLAHHSKNRLRPSAISWTGVRVTTSLRYASDAGSLAAYMPRFRHSGRFTRDSREVRRGRLNAGLTGLEWLTGLQVLLSGLADEWVACGPVLAANGDSGVFLGLFRAPPRGFFSRAPVAPGGRKEACRSSGQAAAERPARPKLRGAPPGRAGPDATAPAVASPRCSPQRAAGGGPVPDRPVQGRARHLRRPGAPAPVGASHTGPGRAHAPGRECWRPSAGGPVPVAAVSRRASGA